jgi:hypothetical protein
MTTIIIGTIFLVFLGYMLIYRFAPKERKLNKEEEKILETLLCHLKECNKNFFYPNKDIFVGRVIIYRKKEVLQIVVCYQDLQLFFSYDSGEKRYRLSYKDAIEYFEVINYENIHVALKNIQRKLSTTIFLA